MNSSLFHEFSVQFEPRDHRFAIVVARYNRDITDRLLRGAVQTLADNRVVHSRVEVAPVPGAWEIPLAVKKLCGAGYSAIICLGAVIRGETTHDQHINRAVSMELARMSTEFEIPISLGLLTCDTFQQASDRAGGAAGNKGVEATRAALDMVGLLDSLSQFNSTAKDHSDHVTP